MEQPSNESLPPITTKSFGVGNELGRLAIELQGRAGRISFSRQLPPALVGDRDPDNPSDFWGAIQRVSDDYARQDLAVAKQMFDQVTGEIPHNGNVPTENTPLNMDFEQPLEFRNNEGKFIVSLGIEASTIEFQSNVGESLQDLAKRSLIELVVRGGVERQTKIVARATKAVVEDLMRAVDLASSD